MVGLDRIPTAEIQSAIHSVPRIWGRVGFIVGDQPLDSDGFEAVLIRKKTDCLPGCPQLVEVISRVRAPRSPEINPLHPLFVRTPPSLVSATIFFPSMRTSVHFRHRTAPQSPRTA